MFYCLAFNKHRCILFFDVQQYKYRDLTIREITNVISQYKDLKPVMDAYGKIYRSLFTHFECLVWAR